MFEIFKKKPYSREEYEVIEKKAEKEKELAKKHPGISVPTGGFVYEYDEMSRQSVPVHSEFKYIDSPQQEQYFKSLKKLEELKNSAHEEALRLEERHNKLVQALKDAQNLLDKFEKEELGVK